MYEYNLLWRHNCGYLYSEERTTGGFLRMATNKPPCVIIYYWDIIVDTSTPKKGLLEVFLEWLPINPLA